MGKHINGVRFTLKTLCGKEVVQSCDANTDGNYSSLADCANAWYELTGDDPVITLASALNWMEVGQGTRPKQDNPHEVALFKAIGEYLKYTDVYGEYCPNGAP